MHQNIVKIEEKDVKQRLAEALKRYGYKQVDISKETGKNKEFLTAIGIHHSSLSLWLQGKLKGHQARIEDAIEAWL